MKKIKILGAISFAIIGGGALASIPLVISSCAAWYDGGDKPAPPAPPVSVGIRITQSTIDENPNYKVSAGTNVYYSSSQFVLFGHDLLNLKALSDDNGGETFFTVTENINFGFLVDPSMDCHLNGINGAVVTCEITTGTLMNAVGIEVGSTTNNVSSAYVGNMTIDNNLSFVISSNIISAMVCGVRFNNIDSSLTQTINGVFELSSSSIASTICGVYFNKVASSNLAINGTFTLSAAGNTSVAYCVYFNNIVIGSITINGTFTASSSDACYCVYFNNTVSGSITINGTFTGSCVSVSFSYAYVVYFNEETLNSLNLTIDGTFTLSVFAPPTGLSDCCGVCFKKTAGGNLTIDGTFALSATKQTYAVYFNDTVSGTLIMNSTQFFSNKVDSSNIFTKISGWSSGTYTWNGTTVSGSITGPADSLLKLEDISDNDALPNFTIKVIEDCGITSPQSESKTTFNTAYKAALISYESSPDCPTVAKEWLNNIIPKIPL